MKNTIPLFAISGCLLFLLQACTPSTSQGVSNNSDSLRADSIKNAAIADSTNQANARLAQVDTLVLGVDVDEAQGSIDWGPAKADGIDFAYMRASKGVANDAKFKTNIDAARREGVKVGAYHQYVIGNDNTAQLKAMQKQYTTGPDDLLPAVRLDEASVPANVRIDRKAAQKSIVGFLVEMEKAFGAKPVVFTTPLFAGNYLTDPTLHAYPLWIHDPKGDQPNAPAGWDWKIWTFSSAGTIAGFTNNVHRSKYHSNSTEFAAEMMLQKP
jgi:lysozyme